jgi:hypothetical protein
MTRHPAIHIIQASRTNLHGLVSDLSIEKLNEIPEGFRNNLIWNVGHVLAIQQRLYLRAGLDSPLGKEFIEKYQMGTSPAEQVGKEEAAKLIGMLSSQTLKLDLDHTNQLFLNYEGYNSSVYKGLHIKDIDDALHFLAFHDGLHLGYAMALKRALLR